ncbi:MAG: hypothetical protein MJB14_01115, partial [Spirochaetes bacterium]|nr:hypothetical protein [Spirochaetota bacterium]
MTPFEAILENNFINPFFAEITLKNHYELIQLNRQKRFNLSILPRMSKDQFVNSLEETLGQINISQLQYNKPELLQLSQNMIKAETFLEFLILKHDKKLTSYSRHFFLKLICSQLTISSIQLKNITNINIYLEFANKIIQTVQEKSIPLNQEEEKQYNELIRNTYLAIHAVRFDPNAETYQECQKLIQTDM